MSHDCFQLADGGHFGASLFFFFARPPHPFDVSLAFPACTFLMWETGGKGGGPHPKPGLRQQIPHFVRPCENEDERVIAIFLYYI